MKITGTMRVTDIKAFIDPASFFFSRENMRFFASKCHSGYRVDTGKDSDACVFITSEKKGFDDDKRVFSVRSIRAHGENVKTLAADLRDMAEARKVAKLFIKDGAV